MPPPSAPQGRKPDETPWPQPRLEHTFQTTVFRFHGGRAILRPQGRRNALTMGEEGGDKAPLAFTLQEARVPSALRDAIYELGVQEIDDFAFAYKDDTALDLLWPKISPEAWEQVGVKEQAEQATSIAAGRIIRKAWHMCKSASQQGIKQSVAAIPTPSTPLKMEPGDWVEDLPPKLTPEAVDQRGLGWRHQWCIRDSKRDWRGCHGKSS